MILWLLLILDEWRFSDNALVLFLFGHLLSVNVTAGLNEKRKEIREFFLHSQINLQQNW